MTRRAKIEQMLQESPDDVFLNYSLAMELTQAGDVEGAQQQFARVRTLDRHYVPAYFQEGQMLAAHGRSAEAREILRQGIAVARQVGDAHALGEMTEFLDSLT